MDAPPNKQISKVGERTENESRRTLRLSCGAPLQLREGAGNQQGGPPSALAVGSALQNLMNELNVHFEDRGNLFGRHFLG